VFVLHASALPGNPSDRHTLGGLIAATELLTGRSIERAYVDKAIAATSPSTRAASSSLARSGVFGSIKR
jgi:transposase, IS5 family